MLGLSSARAAGTSLAAHVCRSRPCPAAAGEKHHWCLSLVGIFTQSPTELYTGSSADHPRFPWVVQ